MTDADDIAVAFGATRCRCGRVVGPDAVIAEIYDAHGVYEGVSTCEQCSREAEEEAVRDIAAILGAPKCAACGGMLVRSGKVHNVIGTTQKWETLKCRRCEEEAMFRVPHEDGCFCTECLG